jgi:hypothetical protein
MEDRREIMHLSEIPPYILDSFLHVSYERFVSRNSFCESMKFALPLAGFNASGNVLDKTGEAFICGDVVYADIHDITYETFLCNLKNLNEGRGTHAMMLEVIKHRYQQTFENVPDEKNDELFNKWLIPGFRSWVRNIRAERDGEIITSLFDGIEHRLGHLRYSNECLKLKLITQICTELHIQTYAFYSWAGSQIDQLKDCMSSHENEIHALFPSTSQDTGIKMFKKLLSSWCGSKLVRGGRKQRKIRSIEYIGPLSRKYKTELIEILEEHKIDFDGTTNSAGLRCLINDKQEIKTVINVGKELKPLALIVDHLKVRLSPWRLRHDLLRLLKEEHLDQALATVDRIPFLDVFDGYQIHLSGTMIRFFENEWIV